MVVASISPKAHVSTAATNHIAPPDNHAKTTKATSNYAPALNATPPVIAASVKIVAMVSVLASAPLYSAALPATAHHDNLA